MPIALPSLDNRTWDDLRRELIARIPAHTPEWTNFGPSDPGITLLELFAFLGENILYRANRIPERNRLAFLRLLGQRLQPGTPARALVAFTTRDPEPITLATGFEVRAGKLGFHLDAGLDVLPIEAFVCHKRAIRVEPDDSLLGAYRAMYAAKLERFDQEIRLYETTPLGPAGVPLGGSDTLDGACWIALLAPVERPDVTRTRAAIAGRVLTLGLAPEPWTEAARPLDEPAARTLAVRGSEPLGARPGVAATLCVSSSTSERPAWRPLGEARGCLEATGVVSFVLPSDPADLTAWEAPEVLDEGLGDVPPALADDRLAARLVCWLRVSPVGDVEVRLRWIGVNAALATQGDRVYGEPLGDGTGGPDQRFTAARGPLVPGSLRVWVDDRPWGVVDDIGGAPREGSPGSEVVDIDPESGEIRCGNGLAGARPPAGSRVRASYHVHVGDAGNLGAGAIQQHAGEPALKVVQAVPTWGGTAPEQLVDGERQVAGWLQHRDRLVTADDFRTLTARTPGVALARVEALPAFNPRIGNVTPGDAPGCVTVLVIPPQARPGTPPTPSDATLQAVGAWLEPRRLVTTEIVLSGPKYVEVVVSIQVTLAGHLPGSSPAEVLTAVRRAVADFLSPLPGPRGGGWALGRPVARDELLVVAAGVPGVATVPAVLLGRGGEDAGGQVAMTGLELPWLAAVAVQEGALADLGSLVKRDRDDGGPAGSSTSVALPVPILPEECR